MEPYNATLSLHQLVENADMCFTLDNEVRPAYSLGWWCVATTVSRVLS